MENEQRFQQFDLHGHTGERWRLTTSMFEGLAKMSVEKATEIAKKLKLDGLAFTPHDNPFGRKSNDKNTFKTEIRALYDALDAGAKHGIIVVPGWEITALGWPHGKRWWNMPHILALGIDPDILEKSQTKLPTAQWGDLSKAGPKNPNGTIIDVIDWIHDNGGVAIAAHPDETTGKLPRIKLTNQQVEEVGKKFDGIETLTLHGFNEPMKKFAEENDIAQIGSSDFHFPSQIGLVRTQIFQNCKTWQDVLEAIKNKQTMPFIYQNLPIDELRKHDLQGSRRDFLNERKNRRKEERYQSYYPNYLPEHLLISE